MTGELSLRNRQRTRALDGRLLRRMAEHLLTEHFHQKQFELGIHLVADREMARVNETFLQHSGSTDVITFSHAELHQTDLLHGEIFICLDAAVRQARQFRTTWQSELVRYLIHGILHLEGFDDLEPAARREMKKEENRLLNEVSKQFPLQRLAKKSKVNT